MFDSHKDSNGPKHMNQTITVKAPLSSLGAYLISGLIRQGGLIERGGGLF